MGRFFLRPPVVRLIALSIIIFTGLYLLFDTYYYGRSSGFHTPYSDDDYGHAVWAADVETAVRDPNELTKTLVVSSMQKDDVAWIHEYFPDWESRIYVMDNASAPLTVEKNKGRESSAYLSYIIDNYESLPMYSVFIHALRYQWHNEDPMYDGVPVIKNLNLSHVLAEGYANLRCTWLIGCPGELRDIHAHAQPNPEAGTMETKHEDTRISTEAHFAVAYRELFPGTAARDVPDMVGVPCGSQFALSRDKIRARPRADYERYRRWLWETPLDDATSGRILEYSWHIIMGKNSQHCPDAGTCFCLQYGLCDLSCTQDACKKRYKLPKFATIPEHWPDEGPGKDGWPARDWWLEP